MYTWGVVLTACHGSVGVTTDTELIRILRIGQKMSIKRLSVTRQRTILRIFQVRHRHVILEKAVTAQHFIPDQRQRTERGHHFGDIQTKRSFRILNIDVCTGEETTGADLREEGQHGTTRDTNLRRATQRKQRFHVIHEIVVSIGRVRRRHHTGAIHQRRAVRFAECDKTVRGANADRFRRQGNCCGVIANTQKQTTINQTVTLVTTFS